MTLGESINALIRENGVPLLLKSWTPATDSSITSIKRSLKTYSSHFWLEKRGAKMVSDKNRKPLATMGKNNIAIITFFSFHRDRGEATAEAELRVSTQFVHAFLDKHAGRIRGVMVDLRYHEGGWFLPVVFSLQRYLNNSSLIQFGKIRGGKSKSHYGWCNMIDGKIKYGQHYMESRCAMPMAVLVGRKTNSSGEIAAAIFKGRTGCKLFGSSTRGHLSVIQDFVVAKDYELGLVTYLVTTPDGEFHDSETLEPDVNTNRPVSMAMSYLTEMQL